MPVFHKIRPFLILAITLAILLSPVESWKTIALAASIILLIGHLLFYNVWRSYQYLKKGAITQAEQLLRYTPPATLLPMHKGIYFFTKGMIAIQQKDGNSGRLYLEKALYYPINKEDQLMAKLHLAQLYCEIGTLDKAKSYLVAAKKTPSNNLLLNQSIQKLAQQLGV